MSGIEMIGFVLGVLGSLEQSITIANFLRNHIKSLRENELLLQQLITSLTQLQNNIQHLEVQLRESHSSIPISNHQMLYARLHQLSLTLKNVQTSLTTIEQSLHRKFESFRKATRWNETCETIQQQLNEAQDILLQFNFFFGNNAAITSSTNTIINAIQTQQQSSGSSTTHLADTFHSYRQKLPLSIAVKPDFLCTEAIEAQITLKLLDTIGTHTKILAIQGPGGVGKTTTLHMLTHSQQLRTHFSHGIYHIKLGIDAKVEGTIDQLAEIVRKSGGTTRASDIQRSKTIEDAVSMMSDWFMDKKYLLLVDDVWEQEQLGSSFLALLKDMIATSDDGGMVFTTRDANLAATGTVFQIGFRDPQGPESRSIMFRHAQQDLQSTLNDAAEEAIHKLLHTCAGLPVAHSIVGKGVLQYSMRRRIGKERAWRMYLTKQEDLLNRSVDGYECLSSVFNTALNVLEEDEADYMNNGTSGLLYSYREMHRSLCILEKQQWAPLDMLRCLWNIKSEERIKEICENFVRVGLAEWYDEEFDEDQYLEGICIHDLVHDFATSEAEKEDEMHLWHTRVVEGYGDDNAVNHIKTHGCEEWWERAEACDCKDGGYLLRNISRHLCGSTVEKNMLVMLVTRPQWIGLQLGKNGILQYERDVSFARSWIQRVARATTEARSIGIEEINMICDAARLSVTYIRKNPSEVWFQLYDRLLQMGSMSEVMRMYLNYIEANATRPWVRSLDGVLTSRGNGAGSVISVDEEIWCIAVLPEETEVVCGSKNGDLMILDLHASIVVKRWTAHNGRINDVTISHSASFFVSVGDDKTANVWQVGTWSHLKALEGHLHSVQAVKISRDEKHIFTGSRDGTIQIWNVDNGDCIHTLNSRVEYLEAMAVVGNSKIIVANNDDGEVITWRIENLSRTEQTNSQTIDKLSDNIERRVVGLNSSIICMDIDEDSSKMVTGHANGSVQLWDIKTMVAIGDPWTSHEYSVKCVKFSTGGSQIVSGSDDRTVQVRDVATGKLVCSSFCGHTKCITDVDFCKEKNSVISCSWDGSVRLWRIDISTPESSRIDHLDEDVWCVTISQDGLYFVTGHDDGRLGIWESTTGQLIRQSPRTHDGWIRDVGITNNGIWIVSIGNDKMMKVSAWESMKVIKSFRYSDHQVRITQVTPSGEYAITLSDEGTTRIWDLTECNGSHRIIQTGPSMCNIFVTEDQQRIVCTASDHCVREWSMLNGDHIKEVSHPRSHLLSREDAMSLMGEPEVEQLKTTDRVFCCLYENEMRYGNSLVSVVLATFESSIRRYAYSNQTQIACILWSSGGLSFLKVEC